MFRWLWIELKDCTILLIYDYEYYVHYTECKEPPCLASRQDSCCLGLGFVLFGFWFLVLALPANWMIGLPFCFIHLYISADRSNGREF